jgi:hypothetical protein
VRLCAGCIAMLAAAHVRAVHTVPGVEREAWGAASGEDGARRRAKLRRAGGRESPNRAASRAGDCRRCRIVPRPLCSSSHAVTGRR